MNFDFCVSIQNAHYWFLMVAWLWLLHTMYVGEWFSWVENNSTTARSCGEVKTENRSVSPRVWNFIPSLCFFFLNLNILKFQQTIVIYTCIHCVHLKRSTTQRFVIIRCLFWREKRRETVIRSKIASWECEQIWHKVNYTGD